MPIWNHKAPSEFHKAARKDFELHGTVKVEDAEVATVKRSAEGLFEATGTNGQVWAGHKLVLAMGGVDIFPNIEGYADCWISGTSVPVFASAISYYQANIYQSPLPLLPWVEERDAASSGILCEGEIASVMVALLVARQALRLSKEVMMYTLGDEKLSNDIKVAVEHILQMKVDSRKVKMLVKGNRRARVTVYFEDGTAKTEGFLTHKPKFSQRSPFAEQLGLDMSPQGAIKVNPPFNQASMKRVFAAGDAANPMQTVTQAISSGTACGGGAPLQLQADTYGQKGIF